MTGTTAFITGAGSGIGRATALEFGRRGYSVAMLDLSESGLKQTEAELAAVGAKGKSYVGSVVSDEAVAAAVADAASVLGSIGAAVTCAGVELYGTAVTMTLEDWHKALDINLTGSMLVARHCFPVMAENGGGAFVAISSDAGVGAAADWAPYTVSKHAVIGLVRSLAVDFGPVGIRSNVVCPAFVETPMADRVWENTDMDRAEEAAKIPLGRFAQASEVARCIAHLASEDASFVNGLVYNIDGGSTASC